MTTQQVEASFGQLGLEQSMLRAVQRLGYKTPTPVQVETVPAVLAGRDVISSARTGSGKTAAFLIPIIQTLTTQRPARGVRVLILSPTRELALQIEKMLQELAQGTRVRGLVIYGGVSLQAQHRALRGRIEVVVATPGRLLDHIRRGNIDLRDLDALVIDEADRMLDMGFLPDVTQIVSVLPRRRQTLLFSATIPKEIEHLAHDIMHNPVRISVGAQDQPPDTIRHTVYPVPDHLKTKLLVHLLQRPDTKLVLVFTRTKWRADRVAEELQETGLRAGLIHGGKTQPQREAALEGFRSGRQRVLVATDVAARGLDIEGITHIINYDVPDSSTSYIHRVGRTARVEEKGEAITLTNPREANDLKNIEKALRRSFPRETVVGFNYNERGSKRREVVKEISGKDRGGWPTTPPGRQDRIERNDDWRGRPPTHERELGPPRRGYQRRKGRHRADWRLKGTRASRFR